MLVFHVLSQCTWELHVVFLLLLCSIYNHSALSLKLGTLSLHVYSYLVAGESVGNNFSCVLCVLTQILNNNV